jgi:large subunit ribosomal protein L32
MSRAEELAAGSSTRSRAISRGSEPVAGHAAPSRAASLLAAMAVPKQKQARSRTRKRRAQHKAATPAFNQCPQCHSPRRPHRVCPTCGFYAGREVVAPSPDAEE